MQAHYYAHLADIFQSSLRTAPSASVPPLASLCHLFVLNYLIKQMPVLYDMGVVDSGSAAEMRIQELKLCADAREVSSCGVSECILTHFSKHAVCLVDAFALPDFLTSPLGRYDGDIYRTYLAATQAAPQSTSPPKYWSTLVHPLLHMHSKL